LFQDFSSNSWHITGIVGDYSGGGIWWGCNAGTASTPSYTGCTIDVSQYAGIRFDVSGSAGPSQSISFNLSSANQDVVSIDPMNPTCGSCTPDASPCRGVYHSVIDISMTPQSIELRWADLQSEGPTLDPAQLTGISWTFSWSGGTPYPLDLTIDNLELIPASAPDGSVSSDAAEPTDASVAPNTD
jgi:hypothetical protein